MEQDIFLYNLILANLEEIINRNSRFRILDEFRKNRWAQNIYNIAMRNYVCMNDLKDNDLYWDNLPKDIENLVYEIDKVKAI